MVIASRLAFHGEPFTHTWIYGVWDREVPSAWQKSGGYLDGLVQAPADRS